MKKIKNFNSFLSESVEYANDTLKPYHDAALTARSVKGLTDITKGDDEPIMASFMFTHKGDKNAEVTIWVDADSGAVIMDQMYGDDNLQGGDDISLGGFKKYIS